MGGDVTPATFTRIRNQLGLKQSELARMLAVHERTVRRYEKGETRISGPVQGLMRVLLRDDVRN
jgi:DNA-binding transcriptional regulator YiaG